MTGKEKALYEYISNILHFLNILLLFDQDFAVRLIHIVATGLLLVV